MHEVASVRPDLVDPIIAGTVTVHEARAQINAVARVEISHRKAQAPAGEYPVIVIDPPWPMVKIEREVRPNQVGMDYPTMSEDELAALKIPAAENAHIWLWTTQRFLPMALRLIEGLGFKYCCTFVWHKPGGFQPIGLPQFNAEFAVYCQGIWIGIEMNSPSGLRGLVLVWILRLIRSRRDGVITFFTDSRINLMGCRMFNAGIWHDWMCFGNGLQRIQSNGLGK